MKIKQNISRQTTTIDGVTLPNRDLVDLDRLGRVLRRAGIHATQIGAAFRVMGLSGRLAALQLDYTWRRAASAYADRQTTRIARNQIRRVRRQLRDERRAAGVKPNVDMVSMLRSANAGNRRRAR